LNQDLFKTFSRSFGFCHCEADLGSFRLILKSRLQLIDVPVHKTHSATVIKIPMTSTAYSLTRTVQMITLYTLHSHFFANGRKHALHWFNPKPKTLNLKSKTQKKPKTQNP